MAATNRIIVAIDFGTTFTGVAYAEVPSDYCGGAPEITVVQDWPKAQTGTVSAVKVPSQIQSLADGGAGHRWGYDIPPDMKRHTWFKLHLETDRGGSDKTDSSAVDITAAFLAHVKTHLFKVLGKERGVDLWGSLSLELVITFPAIWSESAKDKTLKAVDKTGFNKYELPHLKQIVTTTEPEAATLYVLHTMRTSRVFGEIGVGESFLVCDLGGGTVDTVAYEVDQIEPLILKEVTGIQDGELPISKDEMVTLFRPCCAQVVDLIQEQLERAKRNKATVKQVLVVGGFAASQYMYKEIEAAVERFSGTMHVVRPQNPWAAVVMGAVLTGLQCRQSPIVSSRMCRRHYGTEVNTPYDKKHHEGSTTEICKVTGAKFACQRMRWILPKGKDLPTEDSVHVSHEVEWSFAIDEEKPVGKIELKACDLDTAPDDSTNENVYAVATIIVDLIKLPYTICRRKRKRGMSSGSRYHKYECIIELSIQTSPYQKDGLLIHPCDIFSSQLKKQSGIIGFQFFGNED
ncbi:hsp70-like protein [Paraphaeosphaeria minitans]|uniref:Hsp70-like protein n=1 Tax=Paraphaeosphaeria minitans TaxID=565426 RepID=A0A9P6G977_9PLEO|nr:hsp70-like protein [Paraphaeosphaeria minitans]